MFKRDDYFPTKHDTVFPKWQGMITRSMLVRKPFQETDESRRTFADYSTLSRDLAPKILVGANGKEGFRKGKDCVSRYSVERSLPGLSELGVGVTSHDPGQAEGIRSRLRPRVTRHSLLKKLGRNEFTSQRTSTENNQHEPAEEKESRCDAAVLSLSRSRPQSVLDRYDDGFDLGAVCGVILQDGTVCTTTPVEGRKRCTEHKGQRISSVPLVKRLSCNVPTTKECEGNEDICGVILPDMERCRTKPVSRRKRCEEHKGMRTNAFFFLFNPIEREKAVQAEKSKPETCTRSMDKENLGPGLLCEATTKNGLPCTRSAPNGSRRCWQHKDKTSDHKSSENIQSTTVRQVICGVKLYNGSVCDKSPVKGRKRCEEHKGMRVSS